MRLIMIIAALALTGCACVSKTSDTPVASDGKVSFLCVGMEYSGRFGSCPGCARDANNLSDLMRNQLGYRGYTLISTDATKARVVSLLKKGIDQTPEDGLFLFFYSGHGGQEYLGGQEPDGSDKEDEYLCLYDTYMLDDEIWKIVSTCRGRVFLYFDACHSATMYRSVASEIAAVQNSPRVLQAKALGADDLVRSTGFTFRPENLIGATALSVDNTHSIRMLCWSGCEEAEYSYGSSSGGTLTQAVVGNWKKGKTYDALWNAARNQVVREQPGQNPVATHVGGGFEANLESFK